MAKGMSARSGPPPDPNALYGSHNMGEWIELPPEGRHGPTPEWPLDEPTERELELWERQWTRPQAVMWERFGQYDEVALYVRSFVIAENRYATVGSRTLIKQQMEALGISLPGLLRNRWKIPGQMPEPKEPAGDIPARPSVRDRLKVVGDGL